jgi:hypothetical protein
MLKTTSLSEIELIQNAKFTPMISGDFDNARKSVPYLKATLTRKFVGLE